MRTVTGASETLVEVLNIIPLLTPSVTWTLDIGIRSVITGLGVTITVAVVTIVVTEIPGGSALVADAPVEGVPGADIPGADIPGTSVTGAVELGADEPGPEKPGADVPWVDPLIGGALLGGTPESDTVDVYHIWKVSIYGEGIMVVVAPSVLSGRTKVQLDRGGHVTVRVRYTESSKLITNGSSSPVGGTQRATSVVYPLMKS
jgi:hypothetical protein